MTTIPTILTTQSLLDDARAAYHRLMTGTQVVEVRDQNGEMVRYNLASAARLLDYIQTLNDELNPRRRVNGPMQVFF